MPRLGRIMMIVCVLGFALPWAGAQARLKAGETVQTHGTLDAVCVSRDDAIKYSNSSFECERGSGADCAVAKKLQARKVCGFHFKTYSVALVEEKTNLIKVAPAGHASEFYWGDAESFRALFKAGDKVAAEGDVDPVCVKKTDIKSYVAARRKCVDWVDAAQCAAAKKLEAAKACGFHFRTYSVVSVEDKGGVMQLSAAGHGSELYWAQMDDFSLAP